MKPEHPKEIPGVRKPSRGKFQTKKYYIPIITRCKYAVAVAQLEDHESLHPDAHMFFMKVQEEQPDTKKAVITQLHSRHD